MMMMMKMMIEKKKHRKRSFENSHRERNIQINAID